MKKYFLIFSVLIILLMIYIYYNKFNTKFYLDDIYYDKNDFIYIDASKVKELNKSSYIIFTYNNYCNFEIPCEDIFKESMIKNNLSFYAIPYDEYKNTYLYKKVKYAPSVIIVKKGKVMAYLDANSNNDVDKYQDVKVFNNWLNEYIYLKNE